MCNFVLFFCPAACVRHNILNFKWAPYSATFQNPTLTETKKKKRNEIRTTKKIRSRTSKFAPWAKDGMQKRKVDTASTSCMMARNSPPVVDSLGGVLCLSGCSQQTQKKRERERISTRSLQAGGDLQYTPTETGMQPFSVLMITCTRVVRNVTKCASEARVEVHCGKTFTAHPIESTFAKGIATVS